MEDKESKPKKNRSMGSGSAGGVVYGLGLIGAIVYFLQNSNTLGEGIIGVLKAIVWPAFVVYKTLEFLKIS